MRLLLLSLLAVVLAEPLLAQRALTFGFRASGNLSTLILDYSHLESPINEIDLGVQPEFGGGAAVFAEVAFTSWLGTTAEVSYTRRGYFIPVTSTVDGVVVEQGFTTYIDLASFAALGRVRPLGDHRYAPYLITGPQLDVLVGRNPGRFPRPEPYPGLPPYFEDQFPSALAEVSLSGVAGAGMEAKSTRGVGLRVELRYGRSLSDVLPEVPVKGRVSGADLSLALVW